MRLFTRKKLNFSNFLFAPPIVLLSSILFCTSQSHAQNVGIGTSTPAQKLHVVGNARISALSGLSNRVVTANLNGDLGVVADGTNGQVLSTNGAGTLSWISTGDITTVTAGNGLINGGTVGAVTLDVVAINGLTTNPDDIRLGGNLTQATTITQGAFDMMYNLSGTGNFLVQDVGVNKFEVRNTGLSYFGDDVYWNDANTTGTTLARLYDGGSGDDGVFDVYRNGALQHSINADGVTIFNEQASTTADLRVESGTNANMLFVDAGNNRVGIGTGTPTEELHVVGEIQFTGSLEPAGNAGTTGRALLSAGPNVAPTWGVNLAGLTEISRWIYPPTNINANTIYTITANIAGVTSSSSATVNLYGDWATSPAGNITIHHVEARTGQVRFIVQNNSNTTNYTGMDFIITVLR